MRINRFVLVSAPFVFLVACSGLPFFGREARQATEAQSAQVTVEFQDARFDGQAASGRLLIGTAGSSLRLDERIIESIHLTTEAVAECETGKPLSYIVMDVLASSPREEDIIELAPGYWYGKEVRIPLFDGHLAATQGPTCIDVEFAFRALGGTPTALLRVHAVRASAPSRDAGMPVDAGM